MRKLLLYSSFFILHSSLLHAQTNTNEDLAAQYYNDKQYDKAAFYYEKIYSRHPFPDIYHSYLECLVKSQDFKTAEKLVKKQMKVEESNLLLWLDLGNIYKQESKDKDADDAYNKSIQKLAPDLNQINNLGQAFTGIKKYDYALKTYLEGKKLLKDSYPFLFEIGAVYRAQGEYTEMIDSYLDALLISPSYLPTIQGSLQENPEEGERETQEDNILKKELIKYVQHYPDQTVYTEMLIWLFVQERNYSEALVQVKALDKREHSGGAKLMAMAKTCLNDGAYDPAIEAYQDVVDLGPGGEFYVEAKVNLLKAMNQKLTSNSNTGHNEFEQLLNKYSETLRELGKSSATVSIMQDMANLDGFYLHNDTEAVALMREAINLPGLNTKTHARCQMELADILLASGRKWEASLTYSRIEEELREDPIGDEAKFKNATILFYTGNFKWAKAQLDILKAATTKLIANDAMALSLVISDNNQDTSYSVPLQLFANAMLFNFQNNTDNAKILLDSIITLNATSTLKEEVLDQNAQIAVKRGKYDEAAEYYEEEIKTYPQGLLPDKALYYLAKLEEEKLRSMDKSIGYYKQIILNYPGSYYIEEARESYRRLSKNDKQQAPLN